MTFNEYQAFTDKTNITGTSFNCIVGLAGEVGEILEYIKKITRKTGAESIDLGALSPEQKDHLSKELGDCAWYLSCFARKMGVTLEEVAQANVTKLTERLKDNAIFERKAS